MPSTSKPTDTIPNACPQCGGEVYDNRRKKAAREGNFTAKSQDWTCKDTGCRDGQYRTGGWIKEENQDTPPARMAQDDPWKTMEARYGRCQHIAARLTKGYLDPKIDKIEFGNVVHHLSITANQGHFPLLAKPAPTPPQAPEPDDEYPPLPDEEDGGLPF